MSYAALDDIDDAVDATRAFLWPFDLGHWARLAVVVFFIGGSSGVNPFQYTGNFSGQPSSGPAGSPGVPDAFSSVGGAELAIIAAVVGVLLLIALVFSLVSAVMEFVFVESLRQQSVTIRRYWSDRWRQGARLFGFRLVISLVSLLVIGGVLAVALLPSTLGSGGVSVALVLLAVPVFIILALVGALINGFTTSFVVPVMITEDRNVLAAWRRFWPTLKAEWKEYAVYAVMRFVLQIAVGILVGIATLLAVIIVAIPLGILGAVGVGLLSVLELAGWVVIAIAGVLFVLSVFLLSVLAAVPVQTFLHYYALLVLGDTNETFDLIPNQRAAVRENPD